MACGWWLLGNLRAGRGTKYGVWLLVQRVGVAFAWDLHDRQARPSSFRVGPCTAASSAWRSCCLLLFFASQVYRNFRMSEVRFGCLAAVLLQSLLRPLLQPL